MTFCLTFSLVKSVEAKKLNLVLSYFMESDPELVAHFLLDDNRVRTIEIYHGKQSVLHSLTEPLTRQLAALSLVKTSQIVAIEEQNWLAKVQAELHPIKVERLVIHGAHDRQSASPYRLSLEIEAGQAFGTGHHESTHACLVSLNRLARFSLLG